MNLNIERIEILLLVAAFVAILARRVKLPYTVGLVLAGTVLALFPRLASLTLTKELVFNILLPPSSLRLPSRWNGSRCAAICPSRWASPRSASCLRRA